jgi:hypothetical protein
MKLSLHFYLLNEHFSPEYAEANFNGEESENNPKYEWEDELEIDNIKSFEILREGILPLNGELPNGDSFSYEVTKMFLISIINSDDQQAFLGVSESILADFKQEENAIRVYIKDYEPFGNPTPGVYIASKEFPKELIF